MRVIQYQHTTEISAKLKICVTCAIVSIPHQWENLSLGCPSPPRCRQAELIMVITFYRRVWVGGSVADIVIYYFLPFYREGYGRIPKKKNYLVATVGTAVSLVSLASLIET